MQLFLGFCGILVAIVSVFLGIALQLPEPFPDRLAVIPEHVSAIDNVKPYDSVEKWAANGSQAGLHLLNPSRVEYFDGRIRHLLGTAQGEIRLLDAGCGGGLVANALARKRGEYSIEGVDLSSEALQFAERTKLANKLRNVRFSRASVYDMGFANASFDVVIMSDVLEHLHDIPRALAEVSRLLRPGGLFLFDTIDRSLLTFVVAIFGAEQLIGIIAKGSHDWRLFLRPAELERSLKVAGFTAFEYSAFEPSLRALCELSLFGLGLLPAAWMKGGWSCEPPSEFLVSYIGVAVKTGEA